MNTQVENFIHPKVGEGQVDIDLVYNIIRHRLDREVSVEIIEDIRESPGYKAAQKKEEAPGTIDNSAMGAISADKRRLIKCLAAHNREVYSYDKDGGRLLHIKSVCELCNGTGWAFRQDVIDLIDKRYEAEPEQKKESTA